jgi:hypothetical protein
MSANHLEQVKFTLISEAGWFSFPFWDRSKLNVGLIMLIGMLVLGLSFPRLELIFFHISAGPVVGYILMVFFLSWFDRSVYERLFLIHCESNSIELCFSRSKLLPLVDASNYSSMLALEGLFTNTKKESEYYGKYPKDFFMDDRLTKVTKSGIQIECKELKISSREILVSVLLTQDLKNAINAFGFNLVLADIAEALPFCYKFSPRGGELDMAAIDPELSKSEDDESLGYKYVSEVFPKNVWQLFQEKNSLLALVNINKSAHPLAKLIKEHLLK